MRSYNKGPARIELGDGTKVDVPKFSADTWGLTYGDERQVFVPWHRVHEITFADPCELDDDDSEGGVDDAVPEVDDDTGGEPAGPDTDDDDDGDDGKAKEWAQPSNAVMRAWAQGQGLEVSASGPVSNDVASKYAAAHSD